MVPTNVCRAQTAAHDTDELPASCALPMPPKKHSTVWKAEPHTIAKTEMLRKYLFVWFSAFGRSQSGARLLYVDGFAGPGHYTNYAKGSPVAALVAASEAHQTAGPDWRADGMLCVFVEEDGRRVRVLRDYLEPFAGKDYLDFEVIQSRFASAMDELRRRFPMHFSGDEPLFVFIDPFGATGAPFSTVSSILASRRSEVLINFDADGIARILDAGGIANADHVLTEIYGDESWRAGVDETAAFDAKCRQLLALYRRHLLSLPNVRYVFAFEMQSKQGLTNYHLVFASQHPLGLEKMKGAMKQIDQDGQYRFCDASVGQSVLFRFDIPDDWAPKLREHFRGHQASYAEVNDFALNETPFTNCKSMLKVLENRAEIVVHAAGGTRRRGTFPEQKIRCIEFNA